MKLFKASPTQSDEDRARDLRLTAIASRYRPEPLRETASPAEPAAAER